MIAKDPVMPNFATNTIPLIRSDKSTPSKVFESKSDYKP